MKLIDINEKGVLLNLKVNQRILSLDFNYDEFYSDAIEKNDGYEWKQMFISKLLEVKKQMRTLFYWSERIYTIEYLSI